MAEVLYYISMSIYLQKQQYEWRKSLFCAVAIFASTITFLWQDISSYTVAYLRHTIWLILHKYSNKLSILPAGTDPSWHWTRGRYTLGRPLVHHTADTERNNHSCSHVHQQEKREPPINLHVFGLWEEAHRDIWRKSKLQTEWPQPAGGLEPRTFLLWGGSDNLCTTATAHEGHPYIIVLIIELLTMMKPFIIPHTIKNRKEIMFTSWGNSFKESNSIQGWYA